MRTSDAVRTEVALQKMLAAYVGAGLLFLALPGTFLGVWNLVSITNRRSLGQLSAAWIQAHGHAQLFGWLGTFIIGIGFYSLTKMGRLMPFAVSRGWTSWALWTAGVALRWWANITGQSWRVLLPASAALQLAAFALFFITVSRHKASPASPQPRRIEPWMKLVIASTFAFLAALLANQALTLWLAFTANGPAIPHWLDQRYLFLAAWGFPVLAVWGFNGRWLPVFAGLNEPNGRRLMLSMGVLVAGLLVACAGQFRAATLLLLIAAALAADALRLFRRPVKPAKVQGVSPLFPLFMRLPYLWLLIAAALGVYAAWCDVHGGIWGASRHALTVGFLGTMVFAIGQRVLPAFCGMRLLFSKRLMGLSLVVLNIGCALRVASEVPAYEANLHAAWALLPLSAFTELTAVTLFSVNLAVTMLLPPPVPAVRTTPALPVLSQS